MANTLLTTTKMTLEALRILRNKLVFSKLVRRDFDPEFAREGAKIGDTLNIRKPPRYAGTTGATITVEDATETSVALVLNTQFNVGIQFTSKDLALSIDKFSERFLQPAVATIANKIDFDGLNLYKDVASAVGTPATVPAALLTYLQAKQRLAEESAPVDDQLSVVITPEMEATIVNALDGLFQDSTEISAQYKKGLMGIAAGFKWYMDQNIRTHTSGIYTTGSTPLVNGASQTGSTIVSDGWANSTAVLKDGDVITFAGVSNVNPQNRQSTGSLKQFVVTADSSSDGSGNLTIPISPALTPTGQFQTCTASPANNAAIVPLGAESTDSPNGLAFHKDAFALGMARLPLPGGTDRAGRASDEESGLSIRMISDYDITTDNFISRLDVLYGWSTLYPELACRIPS
jgi:hypothetical protein